MNDFDLGNQEEKQGEKYYHGRCKKRRRILSKDNFEMCVRVLFFCFDSYLY